MEKKRLTENDQALRKHLIREVDYWERERWRDDAPRNATNNYYQAREELKEFTKKLREKGFYI